jgi:hypothetical protein
MLSRIKTGDVRDFGCVASGVDGKPSTGYGVHNTAGQGGSRGEIIAAEKATNPRIFIHPRSSKRPIRIS